MYDTNTAFTVTELGPAALDDFEVGLEEMSPEFIQAFCELLAIHQARNSDPIVVVPHGRRVVH